MNTKDTIIIKYGKLESSSPAGSLCKAAHPRGLLE